MAPGQFETAYASLITTLSTGQQEQRYLDVVGKYAYMSCRAARLFVIDLTRPTSPVLVGTLFDATNLDTPLGVRVRDRYAYMACTTRFVVADISNPAVPALTSSLSGFTELIYVDIAGHHAFCVDDVANALQVIDISIPAAPQLVATLTDATNLKGAACIRVRGNFAYIGGAQRLAVVDISNPLFPSVSGNLLLGSDFISIHGRVLAAIGNGGNTFTVVDIANPTAPVKLGSISDSRLASTLAVFFAGRYAYTTHQTETDNFNIIDCFDPTTHGIVATLSSSTALGHAYECVGVGRYVYVAVPEDGFTVIDIGGDPSDSPAAKIGLLEAASGSVEADLTVGGSLRAGNLLSDSLPAPVLGRFRSGRYYTSNVYWSGATATLQPANGQPVAIPFWVAETTDFDALAIEVATGGGAGSLTRLGIYADSRLRPSKLILDAASAASTAAAAVEIVINQRLRRGLYWLVVVTQANPNPLPIYRAVTVTQGLPGILGQASSLLANPDGCENGSAGVSGALPDPFSFSAMGGATFPAIFLKAS